MSTKKTKKTEQPIRKKRVNEDHYEGIYGSKFIEDKFPKFARKIIGEIESGKDLIDIFCCKTQPNYAEKCKEFGAKYEDYLTPSGRKYGVTRIAFYNKLNKYPDLKREYYTLSACTIEASLEVLQKDLETELKETPLQYAQKFQDVVVHLGLKKEDITVKTVASIFTAQEHRNAQAHKSILGLLTLRAGMNPILNAYKTEAVEGAKLFAQKEATTKDNQKYLNEIEFETVEENASFEDRCERLTRESVKGIQELARTHGNWSEEEMETINAKFESLKCTDNEDDVTR